MATWQALVATSRDHYDLVGEYATQAEAQAALEAAVAARYSGAYWCNEWQMVSLYENHEWANALQGYIRANYTQREKRARSIAWHEAELARLRAEEAQEGQ